MNRSAGLPIEEFLSLIKEKEEHKAPLRNMLENLNEEFKNEIQKMLIPKNVESHYNNVGLFIEYICRDTEIFEFDKITKSTVRSKFVKWYKQKVLNLKSNDDLEFSIILFFSFITFHENIKNKVIQ